MPLAKHPLRAAFADAARGLSEISVSDGTSAPWLAGVTKAARRQESRGGELGSFPSESAANRRFTMRSSSE